MLVHELDLGRIEDALRRGLPLDLDPRLFGAEP